MNTIPPTPPTTPPTSPTPTPPSSSRHPYSKRHFLLAMFTLWQREMIRFGRQRSRLATALLFPILLWLMLGFGFSNLSINATTHQTTTAHSAADINYLTYFLPGIIVMVILFTAIFSTISIIEDRTTGFLQGILVAPVSRLAIVLGKILGGATIALAQAIIITLLSWPLLTPVQSTTTQTITPSSPSIINNTPAQNQTDTTSTNTEKLDTSNIITTPPTTTTNTNNQTNPPTTPTSHALFSFNTFLAVLAMFITAISLTALGLCIAWPLDSTAAFHGIMNLVLMPMWFLSGSLFPFATAPLLLKILMLINPLTYCYTVISTHMLGINTQAIPLPIAWLVLLLFTAALVYLSSRIASKPRKDGI